MGYLSLEDIYPDDLEKYGHLLLIGFRWPRNVAQVRLSQTLKKNNT